MEDERRKILDREKGITLIALTITVIVLLILAGITLSLTLGGRGVFNIAKKAGEDYTNASNKEMEDLDNLIASINENEILQSQTSSLIKQIKCIAEQDKDISIFTNLTIEAESENIGDIIGYVIFTNDKFDKFTTEKTVVIKDMPDNICEKITVLAIDKNYKTNSFTVYPERSKKKFIYLYGKQIENLTRAWLDTYDVAWNSDHIAYNVTAEKPGVGYRTTNQIDLSDYSKVCIYYDGYKNYSQANVGSFGYCPNVISAYNYHKNANYVGLHIPYSKYNGVKVQEIRNNAPSSYIYFELYGWVTIKIYGIWLEK